MTRHILTTISALALAGLAHGQITLDWSAPKWSDGTSFSTYNTLRGPSGPTASITPLTYYFNHGVTAVVTASLDTGAQWQNNTSIFGGYAPRVTNKDFFAFGINNGSTSNGGSITLTFSQEVRLTSFTIGDIDFGGSVQDLVNVSANDGALSIIGSAATAPTYANLSPEQLLLTGISTNETNFTSAAKSGWLTLSSGSSSFTTLTVSLLNGNGNHGIWFGNLEAENVVPEPSTYGLMGAAALLALAAYRRSKKA